MFLLLRKNELKNVKFLQQRHLIGLFLERKKFYVELMKKNHN